MAELGDFIDREAEMDDEDEDQEELDEETGQVSRKQASNGKKRRDFEDSSEEEDDDDDEEAAKIREGFIVDDEDEEEELEQEDGTMIMVKKRKKKRRRSQRAEDDEEVLDADDLDLMLENIGGSADRGSKSKFKRLKRGREEAEKRRREESRDLNDIFSEDEDLDAPGEPDDDEGLHNGHGHSGDRVDGRGLMDEFADFIEEDEMSDDGRQQLGSEDEMEMAGRRRGGNQRGSQYVPQNLGLREGAISDMQDIFGQGDDYDYALVTDQDAEQEIEEPERALNLRDVFEPSELIDRMLTEEDTEIRWTDEPERYQLLRKPYAHLHLEEQDLIEEGQWIAKFLLQRKRLPDHMIESFMSAVATCLRFLVVESFEVPFIFQHRKDYLLHVERIPRRQYGSEETQFQTVADKLLTQDDLWDMLELDIKFRAFFEKREALKRTYSTLKDSGIIEHDRNLYSKIEEGINDSETVDQVQDMHDYLHFQYHSQLKDLTLTNGDGRAIHSFRRPGSSKTLFEKIRGGKVYNLVQAFGITAEQIAINVQLDQKREFAEDPAKFPHEIADELIEFPEFPTSESVMQAAKLMLAEEIFMNPRLRKTLREKWFTQGLINVNVTEKGVKQIDEQHQYYEFKYLRKQTLSQIANQEAMFLRMMKAESEGLVEILVEIQKESSYRQHLYDYATVDGFSDLAEEWNRVRKEVIDMAFAKFKTMFQKNVKDEVRTACEDKVASACRSIFIQKLDQAPYKPRALGLGEIPRVFTLSNGHGERGRDATVGIFMDEDGRVLEHVKFPDLKDEVSRKDLVEVLRRRKPDVIGLAGFSVTTHKLFEDIQQLVEQENITIVGDEEFDRTPIDVIYVNDEVARLYQNSDRALVDHPDLPPLARYCVALGRYLQNPMYEYTALGKDLISIVFTPAQQLLPQEKLMKSLESSLVDMVNLVGVDVNEAVSKTYVANLIPYICGLGPRKARSILKAIQAMGGKITSRVDLIRGGENGGPPLVGPKVFVNCSSFLLISHDASDRSSDYLDSTRVHPEDYDLGRKMAADALDFDEEDVAAMVADGGPGAVINELINGKEEKVNELILEEYAEELERNFNQKKRATLETIRAELVQGFEELRNKYTKLDEDQIFTMLTGETKESLNDGMVVPVNIRRVTDRYVAAKLDCGIEGNVSIEEMHDGSANFNPQSIYHVGQTVQARVENLNRRTFYAELSLREDKIRAPRRMHFDVPPEEWDDEREERDKAKLAVINQEQTRTVRVIKHPLFRTFNSRQAEEFLSGQSRGDAVIRPSSNGHDHIAVTWKVSDGIYQHIDVLELDKESEFTVGKTLRVSGKFSYSDLDELIVNHVKAMARKIDELTNNSKFIPGSRADCEKWLEKYCEANPKRSTYAFCFDAKHPGHFHLLFKAGASSPLGGWPVKVIPQAFQLKETTYPDMMTLCNGFKTVFTHAQKSRARM